MFVVVVVVMVVVVVVVVAVVLGVVVVVVLGVVVVICVMCAVCYFSLQRHVCHARFQNSDDQNWGIIVTISWTPWRWKWFP